MGGCGVDKVHMTLDDLEVDELLLTQLDKLTVAVDQAPSRFIFRFAEVECLARMGANSLEYLHFYRKKTNISGPPQTPTFEFVKKLSSVKRSWPQGERGVGVPLPVPVPVGSGVGWGEGGGRGAGGMLYFSAVRF